jgi:hypothetical protein
MKSLLTILLLTLLIPFSHAQKGLSIGANFMPLNTNIVNQDTWGNGHEYDYVPTYSSSFGLDVGYSFNENIGIYTGYWFTDLGQDYEDSYNGSDWERKLTLKYSMIPVMLKFNGTKSKVNFLGGAGILIANLNEAEQEWLRDGNTFTGVINNPITGETFNLGESDVTDRFASSDIFINLEVGARFLFGEKLFLDAGLNFGYGLSDINDEDWQIENNDGNYDPSHNAFVGLRIGLAYMLLAGSE